jgi:hypothetical protein
MENKKKVVSVDIKSMNRIIDTAILSGSFRITSLPCGIVVIEICKISTSYKVKK